MQREAITLRCGQLTLHSVSPEWILGVSSQGLVHVVTVNAEIFAYGHEDPALKAILSSSINTIDGRFVQWISKLLYPGAAVHRLAGSDFIYDLAEHCRLHSERLFLLGSCETSNSRAVSALQARYPGIQISGFSPAYCPHPFNEAWNERIFTRIENFRPQHLVVCFGPLKQEYWIYENARRLYALGVEFAYGLGGTIDFVSGVKKRAPRWLQFIGAEWFFRFACEPRERFRRTLKMFKLPYYACQTKRQLWKQRAFAPSSPDNTSSVLR